MGAIAAGTMVVAPDFRTSVQAVRYHKESKSNKRIVHTPKFNAKMGLRTVADRDVDFCVSGQAASWGAIFSRRSRRRSPCIIASAGDPPTGYTEELSELDEVTELLRYTGDTGARPLPRKR